MVTILLYRVKQTSCPVSTIYSNHKPHSKLNSAKSHRKNVGRWKDAYVENWDPQQHSNSTIDGSIDGCEGGGGEGSYPLKIWPYSYEYGHMSNILEFGKQLKSAQNLNSSNGKVGRVASLI